MTTTSPEPVSAPSTVPPGPAAPGAADGGVVAVTDPDQRERRGRRWLIWSFLLCPCHLPLTLGVLGAVLGGTAVGPLVKANGLTIGIGLTLIYAVGVGIGLRHIHQANKDRNCADGACDLAG